MIARLPIKVFYRPERKRGPTGLNFAVGTSEAEFGDADAEEDPTGLLPDGFATVGGLSNAVISAVEDEGYKPEDYEDLFDGDGYQSEVVLWAVVEDDPAESNEWVRFEEA